MKKGLLILSALAVFACSACTIKVFSNSQPASEQTSENPQGGSQQGGSQGGTSQGGTSQGGTSQGGGSQTSGHDGKSVATAYTVDELLANVNFTDTPSTEIYYVTGTCVAADEYVNTTYHSYSCFFEGHTKSDAKPFQMYSGVFADTSKTPSSLAGCTITFHGKAFTFTKDNQTIYEIGYKKDVADSPVIDAISGESTTPTTSESQGGQTESTSQGGQTAGDIGAHASQTGEVPAGAQTISFDFTGLSSFENMPLSSTKKCNDGTVTAQGKDWNYSNASFHTSDTNNPQAYLALYANEAKAVASFGNKTAISQIVKVSFTLTNTASDRARYVIDFGQSELSPSTDGNGVLVQKGADNSLYCEPGYNATHFRICVRQGVSSTNKASWYNINIATLTVTYVAA